MCENLTNNPPKDKSLQMSEILPVTKVTAAPPHKYKSTAVCGIPSSHKAVKSELNTEFWHHLRAGQASRAASDDDQVVVVIIAVKQLLQAAVFMGLTQTATQRLLL